MKSKAKDPGSDFGFWQGAHWHRACRIFPAAFVLLVVCSGWSNGVPSISQALVTLGCVGFVLLVVEVAFVRKAGFQVCSDALVLCGPIRRVRVPWSQVQGFVWHQRRSRTRTEHLYLKTDQKIPRRVPKNAPVRIPTVAYVFESNLPNDRLLGPLFTSPLVRSRDGREVDAMELLERARSAAVADGNAGA